MAFSVSYNIKAIDEFSKTLNSIQKNFAKFNKDISNKFSKSSLDTNKLNKGLNNINKNSKIIGKNFHNMSSKINSEEISKFDRMVQNTGNSVANLGGKIRSSLGGKIGGLLSGGALAALGGASVFKSSEMAQQSERLSIMVKDSKTLANAMESMRNYSLQTNKPMSELTNTFRLLVEQGMSAKEALKNLKIQTDISAYTGISSSEITEMFTQVNMSGRVTNEIIQRLAAQGLKLQPIIAKMKGMSYDTPYDRQAFEKLIASGVVTSKDLNKALTEYYKENSKLSGEAQRLANTGTLAPLKKIGSSIVDITTSFFDMGSKLTGLNGSLGKLSSVFTDAAKYWSNVANTIGLSSNNKTEKIAIKKGSSPVMNAYKQHLFDIVQKYGFGSTEYVTAKALAPTPIINNPYKNIGKNLLYNNPNNMGSTHNINLNIEAKNSKVNSIEHTHNGYDIINVGTNYIK